MAGDGSVSRLTVGACWSFMCDLPIIVGDLPRVFFYLPTVLKLTNPDLCVFSELL